MTKKRTKNSQKGFTVIELIMATAVFSTVLLFGLTGFIQVGRMFYKGITIAQTRDAARDTLDAVVNDMRLASSVSTKVPADSEPFFICIGNHRYSANLFNQVTTTTEGSYIPGGGSQNYGLLRETLPGGSGCDADTNPVVLAGSPELLGNRMRLLKFDINPVGTNLYNVTVRVAYGDDEDLSDPSSPNAECKNSSVGTQFCSVTELTTQVYRGN